jgi:phage-related protein
LSKNVDERVVEMSFDNARFEKNASETLSTLDKLKEKLNFEGAVKGFDKLEDAIGDVSFDGLNGGIENTSSKFSALEAVALGALMNIGSQIESTAQKLVSSLTIDQISAGWSKYEQKTSSVQTIMNSTGKSMEEVNEQLDKLNWYTDETSYNFLDMVSNIGKFTSNSVELGTAVTAMQGIANWAALSGANVNQASAAMYNLAQAISVGSVKLIDWKSIENANMATTEFKQTVIDTAVELGTLKKTTSGYATVAKGTAVSVTDFNSALSEGWFSSNVLLKSLNEYGRFSEALYGAMDLVEVDTTSEMISLVEAYKDGSKSVEELSEEMGTSLADTKLIMDTLSDSTMELSMKAFKAGQETKTLSEAIAYVKEAVSSGWMNTFELIFGDYEEAKKLWSNLSETLYGVFVASGEARNELLEGALDNSAEFVTKDDWDGLTEGLDITEDLQNGIVSFARENGVAIDDLISQYGSFEKSLKDGWLTSDLFTNYVVNLLNSTDEESETLKDFASDIDDTSSSLSELVDKLNRKSGRTLLLESIKNSFDAACKIVGAFKDAVSDVFPAITSEGIYNAIEKVNEFTESLIASDDAVSKFKNGFEGILSVIRTVGQIVASFIKVIAKGSEVFEGISTVALSIFNLLGKIVTEVINATAETGAFISVGDLLYNVVSRLVTKFNEFANKIAAVIDQLSNSTLIRKFATTAKTIGTTFTSIISSIEEIIFGYSKKTDDATEATDNFGTALENTSTIGSTVIKVITNLLNGINTIIQKIKTSQAVANISTAFSNLKESLQPLVTSIINLFNTVKTSFVSLFSSITGKTNISDIIVTMLETIINGIATLIEWLATLITLVNRSGIFDTIGNGITYVFQSIRNGISGSTENSNFISNIFSQLSKFSDFLVASAKDFTSLNLFDAIKTGLNNVITAFDNLDNSVTNTLKPAIESIRELLGGDEALFNIIGLAEIFFLVKAITSLVGQFKTLTGVTEALSNMMKAFGTAAKDFAKAAEWKALGEMIKDFGIAIGIVAASVFALSFVDTGKLIGAAVAVGIMASALAIMMKYFSGIQKNVKDLPAAATILAFAAALDMLVIPIAVLALVPWQKLYKSTFAVSALLIALGGAARIMGKQAKGAAVILAMSVALNALVIPIIALTKVESVALAQALTTLTVALIALAWAGPEISVTLSSLATALIKFALSVAAIGISVPVSILLFVAAIEKLKSINTTAVNFKAMIETIVVALVILAAALAGLYFASPYITPIIPLLTKLSKALKNIVVAIAGLALVSVLLSGFTDEIALAMTNLINTMAQVIINTSGNVAEAFVTVLDAILVAIAGHAESLLEALWTIIEAMLKAIAGRMTAWEVKFMDEHFMGWLVSDEAREEAKEYGYEVADGVIEGYEQRMSENQSGSKFSAWAEAYGNSSDYDKTVKKAKIAGSTALNISGLTTPLKLIKEIGEFFVEGFTNGIITSNSKLTAVAVNEVSGTATETLEEDLKINSPSKVTYETGVFFVEGLANGIEDNVSIVSSSVSKLADSAKEPLSGINKELGISTSNSVTDGISDGMSNNSSDVTNSIVTIIDDAEVPMASASEVVGENAADSLTSGIISKLGQNAVKTRAAIINSIFSSSNNSNLGLNKLTKTTNTLSSKFEEKFTSAVKEGASGLTSATSDSADETASNWQTELVNNVEEILDEPSSAVQNWLENLNKQIETGVSSATSGTSSSTTKNAIVELGIKNGEYYVKGLTSGITDTMNSEEIAEKKASNIQTAFNKEIDKLDLSETASDLDYELWANLYEETADAQELYAKKTAKISKKIDAQTKKMDYYQAEYNMMVKEFGENSKQAQQAYNDMIQSQIDLNTLNDELKETNLIVYDKMMENYSNDLNTLTTKAKTLDAEEEYLQAIYGDSTIEESKKFTTGAYYLKKYGNALQQVSIYKEKYNEISSEEYKAAFLEAGGTELEYNEALAEAYQDLVGAKTDFVDDWNEIGSTLKIPKVLISLGSNISALVADNIDNADFQDGLKKVSKGITKFTSKYIGEEATQSIVDGVTSFFDGGGTDVLSDALTMGWSFYMGDVSGGITGAFQLVGDLCGTEFGKSILNGIWSWLNKDGGIVQTLKGIISNIPEGSGLWDTIEYVGSSIGSNLWSWVTTTLGSTKIGTTLSSVGSTIGGFFTDMGGTVTSLASSVGLDLSGIVASFGAAVPYVAAAGAAIIAGLAIDDNIIQPFREDLQGMSKDAKAAGKKTEGAFLDIASGMVQIINPVSFIKGLFTGETWEAYGEIWGGLGELLTEAFEGIGGVISNIWDGITSVAGAAWDGITGIVSGAWNTITGVVSTVGGAVGSVVSGVWNGITTVASTVWNGVTGIVSGAWNGITSVVSTVGNAVGNTVSGIWNGIKSVTSTVWNGITGTVSSAWNGIKETVGGVVSSAVETGKNVVNGVVNGVTSLAGAAWDGITSVGSSIVNGFCNFFGIHSPSTVMAELAKFLDLGLANGLTDNANLVTDASGTVGSGIYTAVSEALDTVAALTDSDIEYNPTVTPVVDLGDLQNRVGNAISVATDLVTSDAFKNLGFEIGDINVGDNNDVIEAVNRLGDKFDTMTEAISNMKLVTETGALVGQIIETIDSSLGQIVGYTERGM